MSQYERSIIIAATPEVVFSFHEDTSNLLRISPPSITIELLEVRGEATLGREIRLRMTQFGFLRQELLIRFIESEPPYRLVDQQQEGPFTFWRQTRTFMPVGGGTRLTDRVEYIVPFGALGRLADRLVIAPRVEAMFAYRQGRTREIIEGGGRNGD